LNLIKAELIVSVVPIVSVFPGLSLVPVVNISFCLISIYFQFPKFYSSSSKNSLLKFTRYSRSVGLVKAV